jgi:hypothetical protein
MWISALEAYITKVMDSSYDGDGRKVKEVTWDYYFYQPTVLRYYLRSSVLQGAIIEEIDDAGQKKVGYVYAGDQILAKQTDNQVSWKHTSPPGSSEYNSVSFGGYARVELDPFGADVTLYATAPPEHQQSLGELGEGYLGGLMDARWGNMFNTNGCVADGMPQSCDITASTLNSQNGPFEYAPTIDPTDPFGPAAPIDYHPGFVEWLQRNGRRLTTENLFSLDREFMSELLGMAQALQRSLTEDNPNELQSDNNGKNCGILVTFKPGTNNKATGLPNGPSTITYNGAPNFGLGFSVSGWVGSGGIGTIGVDANTGKKVQNPANPNGRWSLEQWTHSWIGENGKTHVQKNTFSDLPLNAAGLTTQGNAFGYYDHPGGPPPSPGFARYDNYLVKVYAGKTVCEVGFHLVQTGNNIRWGRGLP